MKHSPIVLVSSTCLALLTLFGCSSGGGGGGADADGGGESTVTVRISDATVNEDAGTLTFTVTLSDSSSEEVSVDYRTVGVTATLATDFVEAIGTLLFAPGTTERTIVVELVGDPLNEGEETFQVRLENASDGLVIAARNFGVGTILNDDPQPSLQVEDTTVLENDDGSVTATFSLSLSDPSGQSVEVDFRTVDGDATAGTDYVPASGKVTFAVGQTTQIVQVVVLGDTEEEGDETFTLILEDSSRATLDDATADAMIIDDDEPEPDLPGLDDRPENAACTLLERPTEAGVVVEQQFVDLSIKVTALFQAPGDNSRWFATHRIGLIRTFANDPDTTSSQVFLNIKDRVIEVDDGGLLGLVFHPDFDDNGEAFVFYTGAGTTSEIASYVSRVKTNDGGLTLDPATEEVLLTIPQEDFHKGGTMHFGPDGFLYISTGDAGNSSNGEDLGTLAGKMLRIDVDGGSPYAIPSDNPFVGETGLDEIFAYGLRNPWGWSFDRVTGDIWLGDVGKDSMEEVNLIEVGKNYGWPSREGTRCNRPATCDNLGLTDPVVEYSHDEGSAVIGGFVYRGTEIPEIYGSYLYGDYSFGTIWAVHFDDEGNPVSEVLVQTGQPIRSFAEDRNGELYFVGKDKIFRLQRAGADDDTPSFPTKLSDVPCVDPADPSQPLPGMLPFEVNVTFWSNNGIKDRWFAIPDDTTITVSGDDNWEFPLGTVFLKNFRLQGQIVETRLLVRHSDGGWAGYAYEWNDEETDAVLLPGAKTKTIHGQEWGYPGRGECLSCHTESRGRVLGFRPEQLNRETTYPSTGRTANQLVTYEHIGLFDAPLPVAPRDMEALPDPTDTSIDLTSRARAYLDANCANCHNPDNSLDTPIDFRYQTPFSEMGICNTTPSAGDLGVDGAKLLTPGDPLRSIISLRLHSLGDNAMPPRGKTVVDEEGAALIDAWISSLVSCP